MKTPFDPYVKRDFPFYRHVILKSKHVRGEKCPLFGEIQRLNDIANMESNVKMQRASDALGFHHGRRRIKHASAKPNPPKAAVDGSGTCTIVSQKYCFTHVQGGNPATPSSTILAATPPDLSSIYLPSSVRLASRRR